MALTLALGGDLAKHNQAMDGYDLFWPDEGLFHFAGHILSDIKDPDERANAQANFLKICPMPDLLIALETDVARVKAALFQRMSDHGRTGSEAEKKYAHAFGGDDILGCRAAILKGFSTHLAAAKYPVLTVEALTDQDALNAKTAAFIQDVMSKV